MPKGPRVSVTITADSTGYTASVNKAKGQLIELGAVSKRAHSSMVSDVQATSGALRLIDGGLNNNIRSAERFLASIKGVGAAVQAIYPAVGMIAVGAVIARGVTELAAFVKKTREAKQVFEDSLLEMTNSSRLNNDELAKTNVELENQIAKLTGKHENILAAQLAQARVEADKLAMSAAAAAKQMKELLDKSANGLLAQAMGKAPTGEVFGNIMNFQNLKKQAQQDFDDATHNNDKKGADAAQARYDQMRKNERAYYQKQIAERSKPQVVTHHVSTGPGQPGFDIQSAGKDETANLDALKAALNLNFDESDRIDMKKQNASDEGRLKSIQDQQNVSNKAREAAARAMEQNRNQLTIGLGAMTPNVDEKEDEAQFRARQLQAEAGFWALKLRIAKKGSLEYEAIQKELAEVSIRANQQYAEALGRQQELLKQRDDFISESFGSELDLSRQSDAMESVKATAKATGEWAKTLSQAREQQVANADAADELKLRLQEQNGLLSKGDDARARAALHQREYERALTDLEGRRNRADELFKASKGNQQDQAEHTAALAALAKQEAEAKAKFEMQSNEDAQEIASQSFGAAWKQSLDEFVSTSKDTASQVRDVWNSALSSVNDEIVKMISTRHNYNLRQQFGNIGAGIFRNISKAGLQRGEGMIMSAFGVGKPDGTQGKPLYVRLADSIKGANAGIGRLLGRTSAADGDFDGFYDGSADDYINGGSGVGRVGGWLGKIGGLLRGIAGYADGGIPPINVPSLVGERGPELFVPRQAGSIVSNDALHGFGSHATHVHVDARGATDPAAVEAAAERAVRRAAPTLIAGSLQAMHQRSVRRPSMARG